MNWKHKCSLEWLKKRQQYLTATDVKNLLPVTNTGRVRKVTDEDYLKVMASKMVELDDGDCWSYGAAARGHLLEPYAIDALNQVLEEQGSEERFYHWDDEVIHVPGKVIAFSPDGMDIPQEPNVSARTIHAIAEVKSYSAEKHLLTAYTPKDRIEERWQIAHAMATVETIDHAYLVLFNPKMRYRKLFVIRYDREELQDEIDTILTIEENYRFFRERGPLTKPIIGGVIMSHHGGNEDTIAEEIASHQLLNPVV